MARKLTPEDFEKRKREEYAKYYRARLEAEEREKQAHPLQNLVNEYARRRQQQQQ